MICARNNLYFIFAFVLAACLWGAPQYVLAQSTIDTMPQEEEQSIDESDAEETAPEQAEILPPETETSMIPHEVVRFRSLDKITAQTKTFEVKVGSTVKYGPLYIKVQSCQKNPPIEAPESAAFVQIWEVSPKQKAEWIFSGWMFASSPALSPMDHPVYDVWVLDCLNLEDIKKLDKTVEDDKGEGKDKDKVEENGDDEADEESSDADNDSEVSEAADE